MAGGVRFGRLRRSLALGALFLGVTLVMVRPNPAHLGDRLPANTGDPALVVWTLSWDVHAVARHPTGYLDANIFWPHRDTLAYADSLVPLAPVYGVLHAVTGSWPLALLLLQLALTMLSLGAAFALARWLTGRDDAALLGAIAYTFSGFALAQWGHIQLQTLGLLPLAVLLLFRVLDEPRAATAVLLGLVSVAVALSSLYYGLAYGVAAVVIVAAHGLRQRGRVDPRVLAMLGVAAAVIAVLVWPELRARTRLADEGFRRPLVPGYGLHGIDFLRPAFESYLWRPMEHALSRADEAHRFFPGAVSAVLAVAGLVAGRRRPRIVAVAAAGAVAAVLAGGARIGPVRGPFGLLYDHVPGFGQARVASRLAVVTTLAVAMLAATGFAVVAERIGDRRARVAAVVAAVLMLGELAAPVAWADLPHDRETLAVYRELAQRPAGVVLELPIMVPHENAFRWATVEAPRMVYGSFDWHPRVNGYSGFVPPGYEDDTVLLNTFPSPPALLRARQLGVRYVVFHAGAPAGYAATRYGRAWLADLGPQPSTPPNGRG